MYDGLVRSSCIFLCLIACGRFGFPGGGGNDQDARPNGDASSGDASAMIGPSCTGLAVTCGGSSSCCRNALVPGGAYYRSYDNVSGGMYTATSFPAMVPDFRLDIYEVTVGRFRRFVEAGMGIQATAPAAGAGAHAGIANSGWDPSWNGNLQTDSNALFAGLVSCSYSTWTDVPGANENLPLNCVTWYESFAFCIWDGGYLPTESDWNYAASGGAEQRAYPWSSPPDATTIDCSHADYDPAGGYCVNPPNGGLLPVGSMSPQGDGKWGHADLAGGVWEKTLDVYSGASYSISNCDNCADLSAVNARVVRGGAWNGDQSAARVGYRYYDPPTDRYIEMGLRCARAP
jgi:formylglycine-generating enzyme required for sulfatase activity